MPLNCNLDHKQASAALQGFQKRVITHSCGILTKSRVNSPGYSPRILTHKPSPSTLVMHHSPCLPHIQSSFFIIHLINPLVDFLHTSLRIPHYQYLIIPICVNHRRTFSSIQYIHSCVESDTNKVLMYTLKLLSIKFITFL